MQGAYNQVDAGRASLNLQALRLRLAANAGRKGGSL